MSAIIKQPISTNNNNNVSGVKHRQNHQQQQQQTKILNTKSLTSTPTSTLSSSSSSSSSTGTSRTSSTATSGETISTSSSGSDPLESDFSEGEVDEINDDLEPLPCDGKIPINKHPQQNGIQKACILKRESIKNVIVGGNERNNVEETDVNDDDDEDDNDEEEEEEEEEEDNDGNETNEEILDDNDYVVVEKEYELNDFQIIKTIGTGTFGRVCLCRDKAADTFCAMKILAMADVIRLKQVEHVKNEKNILSEINHPFIVNLRWYTRDDCCLYMLFEYVCGGELFSYLRNAGRFGSSTANFYACEIIVALDYLHSLSIVYRDLKPENLLIDRDGHLKITDFGFAKKLKDRTWTLCGTPEYLAPEIIQSKGHNKAVDWWALGVLIYEMLIGYPPFYDDNPFGIYEKILSGKTEWPRHMDPIAKDLVKKLLVQDRTKRLGNMKNGADDVKRHRWFKNLDWDDVYNRKLKPPIIPRVHFDGDTSNFDEYPETDFKAARSLDKLELQLFDDF